MSSAERIDGGELNTTWTYDTPYDVVHRRRTIRKFGASSMRAVHMANYIDYMNNAMPPGYVIGTYIDVDKHWMKNGAVKRNAGTQIYRPDEQGRYERYAHIVVDNADMMFFGDKIIMDGQDVVVLNTEADMGVSPTRTVKMIPVRNTDIYLLKETYENNQFDKLVNTMRSVKKGIRHYDWDEYVLHS